MKYGLIGEHLTHSFSKQVHYLLGNTSYELKEIDPSDLSSFMTEKDFIGINVTIPYKESVIPFLDEISVEAKEINAVNTIVNDKGKLKGYNTDCLGFEALLKYFDINVKDKVALVLGTGGASKAVTYTLKKLGASNVLLASIKHEEGTLSYEDIYLHQEVEIIVNATPVGMYPSNDKSIIEVSKFKNLKGFVDVIYNPINTKTVVEAKRLGIKAVGGLYMLILQAVKASELFLNAKYDDSIYTAIYKKVLLDHINIVLIGMPSSGKSLIAQELNKELNFTLVEMDKEIEEEIKMPIKDYFATNGEQAFRDLETKLISNIYQQSHQIISTGGGVILRKENMDMLSQNGIIFFIKRDLSNLVATSDRPLSSNINDLTALYNKRLPLYESYADYEIDNNGSLEDTINQIKEILL